MNSCYIFSDENLAYLKGIISAKFKKVAVLQIKINNEEQEKFINGKEKDFFIALIDKFEKQKEQNDFVIVVGCENFSVFGACELNLKIAKNLNCPVFEPQNFKALKALNPNSKLIISGDIDEILSCTQEIITPYKFENILLNRARSARSSVVLPESDDERVLHAAEILLAQGAVDIVLLGNEAAIKQKQSELGLNLSKARIIDPQNNDYTQAFAAKIYELRKAKGVSEKDAERMARDKVYFATMLVNEGMVGAMVSGASMSTADTIRPALQIIKTKPQTKIVSGLFFMALEEEILLYADCAITPNPSAEELAGIAVITAQTAASFGLQPRVAMLSYSTADSGSGPDVEFVKLAAKKALEIEPNLSLAAPIQYDAAVDVKVGAKKMPNSSVAGRANVFIFPNLNCANICYKAVQRSANALAVGPVLQGLKKPVNDLSRGCLVEDIVNTVLISAIQAGE
ncbi:phosphate acetyltransferase [Campylobacter curvus]|uniref:phosphate acetyltransferase n=1 Tax=Campylobacter curvus TaxID=200 RepID=UPI0003639EDF|nr:phosphate acetyltransferase [Campylobacter curvus]QKF61211.1 phosphate acetyltransferase [Campylobacter curvus]UEB49531.1 phosphate acetyltransferase [Campylobacter curvus]